VSRGACIGSVSASGATTRCGAWLRGLTGSAINPVPPVDSLTTWHAHYRRRLGNDAAFDDRIFDPAGGGPPIWFQKVPESKAGKNRLHLDVYPTGRDDTLTMASRVEIVDARVAELVRLGASVDRRTKGEEPGDEFYYVVMRDPEGNEFCIS
jgi:hypothetical protein